MLAESSGRRLPTRACGSIGRVPRLAAVLCALAACLATASSASAAQKVISSAGPLAKIYLNDDLACSLDRGGVTQVAGGTNPGSCGTFLATGGVLYGPVLPLGPPVTAYTPVSQTAVSGTGTPLDPFTVTTDVNVGATGIHLQRTDQYATGDNFYKTTVVASNSSLSSQNVVIYHAADCALKGNTLGYGYSPGSGNIYCSGTPNSPATGLLGFEPITPGSHFLEAGTWTGIAIGSDLADTCDCSTYEDNGAGIDWSFTLAASGGSQTRVFRTRVTADTVAPQTTITAGPQGTTGDNTPSFGFVSNEPGSTFQCSIDSPDPPTPACVSPFESGPLSDGPHVVRVRATDVDGNVGPTQTRSFSVETPPAGGGTTPDGSGTTTPPPAVAPPVAGKSFDAKPVSGKVYVKCSGQKRRRLTDALNLPVGCVIDARKGKVRIVSAANRDSTKTKSAIFYDGQFKVREKRSSKPVTELRLAGNLEGCSRKSARSGRVRDARRRKRRRGRRLWGRGRGRFRTRGRRSAASVRGTTWLVQDRCDGSTLTKVRSGKVTVRDFVKRKTVVLKKGQSYVAKSRKRRR